MAGRATAPPFNLVAELFYIYVTVSLIKSRLRNYTDAMYQLMRGHVRLIDKQLATACKLKGSVAISALYVLQAMASISIRSAS
jgi:hypothetical protein